MIGFVVLLVCRRVQWITSLRSDVHRIRNVNIKNHAMISLTVYFAMFYSCLKSYMFFFHFVSGKDILSYHSCSLYE